MKSQSTQCFHKDTPVVQEYKKKINDISSDPSALTRFRKTEAARMEMVRRLCREKKSETAGYGMEIVGIVTTLLGGLSIVATTHVMEAYVVPTGSDFVIMAPSIAMLFMGIIITNMGAYRHGISHLEEEEQRDEVGNLSRLIEEMEKMEGKIVRDHGAEIVAELSEDSASAISGSFPRLKECLLRQLQY